MSKNKNNIKNEGSMPKIGKAFSLSEIVNNINSVDSNSFENDLHQDVNESMENTVSENGKRYSETKANNKETVAKGTLRDYIAAYADDRNFKCNIYVHEDIRKLLCDIKERLSDEDKFYVNDLANAMIYGFFVEHMAEIKSMLVKIKKRKSLID